MPADAAEIVRLAEMVEQATGPDRDLDAEIAVAVLGGHIDWRQSVGTMESYPVRQFASSAHVAGHGCDPVLTYTASLDAAMTLVPNGVDASSERFRLEEYTTNGVLAEHVRASAWVPGAKRAFAATPALALTAAALRARAAQHDREVG